MKSERTSRKENPAPPIKTAAVVTHLKTLDNGWNGGQAKKPTAKAIKQAGKILTELERGHMPWPQINVMANGGTALTWVSLYRDVLIAIGPDGSTQFTTSIKKLDESFNLVDTSESEGFVIDTRTIAYMMVWFCTEKAAQA